MHQAAPSCEVANSGDTVRRNDPPDVLRLKACLVLTGHSGP